MAKFYQKYSNSPLKKEVMDRYLNKVVVITGATGSLGRELCFEFTKRGSKIAICSRSEDKLKKLSEEISQIGGRLIYKKVDVSIAKDVKQFINFVIKKYGDIDVLVNNAGIINAGNFLDLEEKMIEKEISINYLGPVYFIKEVLPMMLKKQNGQIINISSIVYFRPFPFLSTYSASKAALSALTDALRSELQDKRVKIIHVCMGKLKSGVSLKAEKTGKNKYKSISHSGMEPIVAARKIINNASLGKEIIYTHFESRPILWLNAFFPSFLDKFLYHSKIKTKI